MDPQTLDSLAAAYTAAPSSELANILVKSYIESAQLEQAKLYLGDIDTNLAETTLISLCTAFAQDKDIEHLSKVAAKLDNHRFQVYLDTLEQSEHGYLAKNIYQSLRLSHPELKTAARDQHFQLVDEKIKLRVIDTPNTAEVLSLTHHRQPTTNFSDVVGLEAIKKQINKRIILPFQKPSIFQRFKKKVGGGVLLYGPPGCGKTLLARATAGECNASFFNVEVADILDMYIGESEQKLKATFDKARQEKPAVIFFDELEALAGKREHARNNATSNTISQFLTELDGFSQQNDGILVLASTNVPWAIDSAFLRPGRFDRMFFIPPPDAVAREAILKHHMTDRPMTADIAFNAIAQKTSGYSGADLANLIEMAADEAIDETIETGEETEITMKHFTQSLGQSRATTTEWLTTARNYARYANDGGRYNDVLDFIKKHGK
ncbi:ATP-binding protein [Motilimonas sp. E26]|uniref:ATP-binding protein n=1 Tax=Motilimonas sp. E26 TaxID=2865674 RepID=UPI001E55F460|nr:ATP-binding protein [Motilimonas sp. E26]MCE0557143.1 ATP-binding protein [Motilimonas sp. E26]